MKEPKNILIFTKEYDHPKISNSGGTGIFYKNFAEKLSEKGYKVFVFGSKKRPVSFEENGIAFYFVKDYFQKNRVANLVRSVSGKLSFFKSVYFEKYLAEKKYLKNELQKFIINNNLNIDIIETHDWEGLSLYIDELNIPYVIRCHGSWSVLEHYFNYPNVNQGKVYCEHLAFAKSKNNIAISKYSKKINQEIFNLENPVTIYNGINTSVFAPDPDSSIIPQSIFYFGNLSHEKGADDAADIFESIFKNFPKSTLHFIGNTNEYNLKFKKKYSAELFTAMIFHGQKETQDVVNLLRKAEIVIFPSKGETFGLALAESMSVGKAVVASKIPVFQEIVENGVNGFLADDNNDFVDRITMIFKDEQQRKVIETRSRQTIIEKFGSEKCLDDTIKYYKEII